MEPEFIIRILEKDSNRRGDLFGRLMVDLFIALGYDQSRLNVHKSGREIDLTANHRLEPRRAVAECKATEETIGGGEINKFVGALDAEQGLDTKRPATGYFVSLAGFTETAKEQEANRASTKLIILDGHQVVRELVHGRIVVAKEKVTEIAGRCCSGKINLTLDTTAELLAHERGWIWAVYYTQGKLRTHFVLIHSDGTPLASALVTNVVASDNECGGKLHTLACLNPEPQFGPTGDSAVKEALAAYGQYVANECGYIQLDGLPADNEVGSRRLKLENLFVPLHFDIAAKQAVRQPVGSILKENPRVALLAAPGGGKSMLIKRLAVAYADSTRFNQISDNLPKRDWLPLFFRCRELRGLARGSFADLLEALSQREPVRHHSKAFGAIVDRKLLDGKVLLLVDGLDEISEPGDRAAFVCTLRAALQAYPGTAIVVTSREAGFRHVASHLSSICTQATLSHLNPEDISRLCIAWHREVLGDKEKVVEDAQHLADTIIRNDRISRLATNPLLLTTLLLVKRWVGSLPTRRTVLYSKAVEVLLMTWNTEGHEPIREEEALPQLCYVASKMMLIGVQKISRPRLATLLEEARSNLPTELGYVKGSVDEFIHRVEDRSSLLMMSGHDVENGQLVEFFEFRHLTFQEFLTARAMVEGWHPNRGDKDTLVTVLEKHLGDEKWREVIPLAAVMGGKTTEALIIRLTAIIKMNELSGQILYVLVSCLADEAAARPDTIRAAIHEIVKHGSAIHNMNVAPELALGRYGPEFREQAGRMFVSETGEIGNPGDALVVNIRAILTGSQANPDFLKATGQCVEMLKSSEVISRCEGATGIGSICSTLRHEIHVHTVNQCRGNLVSAVALLEPMLQSSTNAECCGAVFALEHIGACRIYKPPLSLEIPKMILNLWQGSPCLTVRNVAVRAFTAQQVLPRDSVSAASLLSREAVDKMVQGYEDQPARYERQATLILAWYLRALSDNSLVDKCRELMRTPDFQPFKAGSAIEQILEYLDTESKQV